MVGFRALQAAALCACLNFPLSAGAQDVTLTSHDGTIEVSGHLVGFDGEFYRVESEFGTLVVDGTAVTCAGPACPDLNAFVADVVIAGTPLATRKLLPAMIAAFARTEDLTVSQAETENGVLFSLHHQGNDGRLAGKLTLSPMSGEEAFADLVAGEADLVVTVQPPKQDQATIVADAGLGDITSGGLARIIAFDAVVPVVAARNPVMQMKVGELAAIFSGEIDNWRQLGGVDAPIERHVLSDEFGLNGLFASNALGTTGKALAPDATVHDSAQELAKSVAADPFAIGLAPLSETGATRVMLLHDRCGFRFGVHLASLASDDYPFVAPIFVYRPAGRLPNLARNFLRFLESPAGQITARQVAFASRAASAVPLSRHGERLASAIRSAGDFTQFSLLKTLVDDVAGRERLALSLRFDEGTGRLDPSSLANIATLAEEVEAETLGSTDLLFAGFSALPADGETAKADSAQAARIARKALVTAAATADLSKFNLTARGYGAAIPLACQDSDLGARLNRRVEVWVKRSAQR